MARSRHIWGPYEVNPANPVLGKTEPIGYIQYTGHGDLFQSPAGQWYFVCLGVRKKNGRFIMGRESVLTTATWPEGEYPVIDVVQLDVPLATEQNSSSQLPNRRNPRRPDVGFVRIRDPVEEHYEHNENSVTLTSSKDDLSQYEEPVTFIGKRQRLLEGSSSATLEPLASSAPKDCSLKTGLAYYKDETRFARLFLDVDKNEIVLEIVNKAKNLAWTKTRRIHALNEGTKITFGVDYTELEFVYWYVVNTRTKEEVGRIDTLDLTGHDFVGPVIGVFAIADKERKVKYSHLQLDDL